MNRLDRLIRRALAQWQSWQTRRRLEAATRNLTRLPEMRRFENAERDATRRHGRVNDVRKAKQAFIHSALREGRANG